jgi:cell division protein FtsW (lipid II flippase)
MFTSGQLVFAILFAIGFIVIIYFSYKKDKRQHKKHYKGAFWILVGFFIFLTILTLLKYYLTK